MAETTKRYKPYKAEERKTEQEEAMQGIRIREEAELTENTNKPEPETPETPAPQPQPECTALAPPEPDVIEGEVIAIEQPEISEDHIPPKQKSYWLLIPLTILFCLLFVAA